MDERTRKELTERMWYNGRLDYLLDEEQLGAYHSVLTLPDEHMTVVDHCSRRGGKSYKACTLATTYCLLIPRAIVLYGYSVGTTGVKTVKDVMDGFILPHCPPALRPEWFAQARCYRFPNGAELRVFGLETVADIDNARGSRANLLIIDEAGYIRYLDYALQTLSPMLLGQGKRLPARILLCSSSATQVKHAFFKAFDRASKYGGAHLTKLPQISRYSAAEKNTFIQDAGGIDSPQVRVEYFCARMADLSQALLPEFAKRSDFYWAVRKYVDEHGLEHEYTVNLEEMVDGEKVGSLDDLDTAAKAAARAELLGLGKPQLPLIRSVERPKYYTTWLAVDIGFAPHHTFIIAGYVDANKRLVMVGERDLVSAPTPTVAAAIEELEREAFGDYWLWLERMHPREPGLKKHLRYQDVDPRVRADMALQGIHMIQIDNKNPKGATAVANTRCRQQRVIVDPACEMLITQCVDGQWNGARTSYAETDEHGHYDGVSAFVIACNNVPTHLDPNPLVPLDQREIELVDPELVFGENEQAGPDRYYDR